VEPFLVGAELLRNLILIKDSVARLGMLTHIGGLPGAGWTAHKGDLAH
jgi:deoxycytidine triphosphate deaminase